MIASEINMFPSVPQLKANWAPIYLEPMQGSGERLVALVVASGRPGTCHIERTLRSKTLHCMYGDHGRILEDLVDIVSDALAEHLAVGMSLSDWVSPVSSCSLGTLRTAVGESLELIAMNGATLTASLVRTAVVDAPLSVHSSLAPEVDAWLQQIRSSVRDRVGGFEARFNTEIVVKKGAAPTRIGYLGSKMAANFDVLVPGPNFTAKRHRSKARLLDLQLLRDQVDTLFPRQSYELMLWLPEKKSPAFTEKHLETAYGALAELEEFGDKHELIVRKVLDADAAASRILQVEGVDR